MWLFKRNQEQSLTTSAKPETNPQDIAPRLSADELLLESIQTFREHMRSVEIRVREEHQVAISDDQKKIEYSNQFIRRAGLDSALLRLLKEMWHWPAWIKRSDFDDHRRVELAELSAEEVESTDRVTTKKISFTVTDNRIRFEFEYRSFSFDDYNWGEIRLFSADELVLSIKVYRRLAVDARADDWNYHTPTVLKIGPWVGTVIELEHKFRLANQKWFQDIEAKRLREQAQELPNAN